MEKLKWLRLIVAAAIAFSPCCNAITAFGSETNWYADDFGQANGYYLNNNNTSVTPNQNYPVNQDINNQQPYISNQQQYIPFETAEVNFLNEVRKTSEGIAAFNAVSGIDITNGYSMNDPNLFQQVLYQFYDEQGNQRIGYTDPVAGVQALINYVNDQQAAAQFNSSATNFLNEAMMTQAGIDAFKAVSGIDISRGYDLADQNLIKQVSFQLFDEQGNKRIGFSDPSAGVQALIRYVYNPQTAETNFLDAVRKTTEGIAAFKAVSGIDITDGYNLNDQNLVNQVSNQLYDEQGKVRIGYTNAAAGVQALIKYVSDQQAVAQFKTAERNFLNEVRKTPEGLAAFKAVTRIDITNGYSLFNEELTEQVSYLLYDDQGKKQIGFSDPVAGVQALIKYYDDRKVAAEFSTAARNFLNAVWQTPGGIEALKAATGFDISSGYNLTDPKFMQQISYQLYDEQGNKRMAYTDPVAGVQALIQYVNGQQNTTLSAEFSIAATNFLNEVRKTSAGIAAFKTVSGIDITNGYNLNDENLVKQVTNQLYDEQGNERLGYNWPVPGVQALIKYVNDQQSAKEFKTAAKNFLDEVRKTPEGLAAFKAVTRIDISNGYSLFNEALTDQVSYLLYDEQGNKRIGFSDPAAGVQALVKYYDDRKVAAEFNTVARNFLNAVYQTAGGIEAFKAVSGIDISGGYNLTDPKLIQQVSYQLYDEQGNQRIGYANPEAGAQALIQYVKGQQNATLSAEFSTAATNFLNEVRKTSAGIAAFKTVSGIDITNGYNLSDQNLVKQVTSQLYDEQGNERIGFNWPVAGVNALIKYVNDQQSAAEFKTAAKNFLDEVRKTPEGLAAFKAVTRIDISNGYSLFNEELTDQVSYLLYDEQGNKRVAFSDPAAGVQALIKYSNDRKAAADFKEAASQLLDDVKQSAAAIAAFKAVSGIDITNGYNLNDQNTIKQVSYQLFDAQGNKRAAFDDPAAGVRALLKSAADQAEFKVASTNFLNEVRKSAEGIAAFKSVSGIDVTNGYDLTDKNLVQQLSYQLYDENGNKRVGFTDPVAGVQALIKNVADQKAAADFNTAATNFLNEVMKSADGIAAFKSVSGIDVTNGYDLTDKNLIKQISYQLYDEDGNKRVGFTNSFAGVQDLIKNVADQKSAAEFNVAATNFLNEVRKSAEGIAAFKSVSGIDVTNGYDLKDKNLVEQISYQLFDENGNKRAGFTDPVAGVQALIKHVSDQKSAAEFNVAATNFLNEIMKSAAGIAAFRSVSGIDVTNGFDLTDKNLIKQISYQLYDEDGNKRAGFTDPVAGVQALIKHVADQKSAAEFNVAATNFLNEVMKSADGIAAFKSVSGIDVTDGYDLTDKNLIKQISYQLYDEDGNKRAGFTDPVAGVQALIKYVADQKAAAEFNTAATNFLNEVMKSADGIAAFKSLSGIDVTNGYDLTDKNLIKQISYQLYDEQGNKRIGFTDPVAGVQSLIDYVAFIGVATNFLNEVRKTPAGIAAFKSVSGIDVTNGFDLKDQNLVTQVSYQLYDEKGNKRIGFNDPVAGVQGLIDYVAFIGVATNFLNEVRKTPEGIAAFKSVSGIDVTNGFDLKDQNLVTQVSYQLYDEKGNKRIGFTDPVAGVQGLIDYVAFIGVATNFLNEVRKTPAGIAAFKSASGIDVTNGFDLKDQNLVTQVSYQLYDEKGNKRIGFTDPVAGVEALIGYVTFIGVATNFLNEVRKTPEGIAAFKSVSGIDVTNGFDLKDQNLVAEISYQLYDEKGNKRIGFTDPVAGVQGLIDYVAFIGVATNFLNEVRKTPAGIAAFKSVSGIDVTSGFDLKDQNLVRQVSYQLYDEKGNKRIGFTDPVAGVQSLIDYVAFIGVATNFLNEVRKTADGIAAFKSVSGIDITSGFDLKDQNLVTQVSYQLYDEKGNKRIGFTDPVAGVQGLIDYVAFIGVATNFLNEVRKTPEGIAAFKSVSGIDVTSGFDLKDQNLVTQVSYQLYDEKGNKRIGFTDPVAGVQSLIDYVAFIGVATNFLNEVRKTPEGIAAFKSVSRIDITDGYDLKDKNLVEQVSFQLYDEKGNKRIGFTDPVAGVQALIDYVAFIGVATNFLNEVRKTADGIAAFKSVSGIDITSGFDLKDQNLVTQVSYQLYDEKGNKRIGFTDPVAGVQGLIDYVAFIGVATNFLNEVRKTPEGIAAFKSVSGIDVTSGFDLKDQNLVTQVSYQLYDEKGNKRIGFTDPVAGVQSLIDYVAFIGVATNFLNEVRKTPAGIAAFKSVSGIDVTSGFDLKDQNLVTQVSYQLYDEKGNKRIGFTDPVAGVQGLIDYVAFIGVATNFLNEVRKTPAGIAAFKSVSGIDVTNGFDLKDQNLVTQVSYQLYDEKGNKRIGFTDPVAGVQGLIDYVAFIGVATNFLNEVRKTPEGIAAFKSVSGIDVTSGFDLKDQNLVTQVSYQLYDEKGNKRIGFTDPVAGVQSLIDYVAFIGVATNFLNEVRKTPEGIAAFKSVSGIDITDGYDLKDQNLVTQVSYQLYDEKGNKRIGFTDPVAGVQGLIDYVAFIGVATNFLNEVRKTPEGIAAFKSVSGIDVTSGFDLKDQNLVTQVSYQLYDEKGNKRIGFTDPVAGVQALIDYVAFIGVATNFLNEVRKTPAGIAAFKSVSGIDITDGYDLKDQNLVTQVSYQLYDEKGNKRIGFIDPVAGVQSLIDYVAFIGVATNFLNEVRKTPAGIAAFKSVSGIDVTSGFDLKDQNLVTQVSYQLYDEKGNKRIGFTDPVAGVQALIDYVAFIGVATNFLNEVRKTPEGIAAFKSVSGIDITDGYDLKDKNLVEQVSFQLYDEKGNKRIGFTDPVAGVQGLIDYVAFIGVATNFLNEVRKTPEGIAAFKSVSGIDITDGYDLKDKNLVEQVSFQLYDEKGNKRIGFTDPVAGVQGLIDYVAFIGVATNFLNEVRKTPEGIAAFKSVSGIDITDGYDLKDQNLVTQVSYQLYDEKGNKRIGFTDPVAGVQALIDYVAFIGVATNFLNEVRKTPAGIAAFKSVSGIDVTSGFDLKDQNLVTQVSYQLYDEKGNKRIGFTDPVAGVQALIDYVAFIGVATNFLNEVRKTPAGIAAFKSVSGIDVTSGFDLKDQNLVTQVSYQLYDEKGNKRIGFTDPVAGVQALIDYVAFIGVATNFLNEVRKTPEGIAAFKSVSGIDITDGYDLKDKNLVEQVSFQLYDEKGNKRIGFTDPVAGVQGLIDYVAFIGVATNFLNEVRKSPAGIAAFKSVSGIDVTSGFDLKDQNLVTQVSYQLYDEKGNKRIGFTDPVAGVQALIDYVAFIGVATNFLNEVRKTPAGIAAFKSVSGIDVTSGFDLKDQNLVTQVSYQLYDEKGNKRIGFTDPVAGVQALIDYVAFIGVATNFLNEVRKTPAGIAAFKSVSGIDVTSGFDLKDQNLVTQVSYQLYDEKGNKRIGFTDPVAGVQALIDYVAFIGVATNFLNEVRKTPAGIAAFKSVSGIDVTSGFDLKDQNLVTQVSYQLYDEKGNKRIGFTDPVAGVQGLIDYVAFIGVATNFLNEVRKTPAGIAAFRLVSGIDVTNGFDLKDQNLVTQVSYQLYDEKGNKRIGFTDPVAGVQALIDYVAFIGVATNFLNEVRKTPAGIAAFKSVSGIDVTSGFDLKDQNLVTQVSYQLYDEKGNKRIGFTDPVAGVQSLIDYVAFIGVATNFLNEVRKTPEGIAAFKSVSGIDITDGYDLKDKNLVEQVSFQLYDEKGNKRIGFTDPVAGVQGLIDYVAFIGVATNFLNEVRKTPEGIAAFKSVSGIDVTNGFDLKDQNLVTQVSYQLYDEKGNKRIGFTDPVAGVQSLIDYVAFIGVATNFLNEVRKTPEGIAAFKSVSGIDVTNGFDLKDQNLVTQVSYQLYDEKGNKRIGFTDPVAGVQGLIDYVAFIGVATNFLNEVRKTPEGIAAFKSVSGIDITDGYDLKDQNLVTQVSYQLYDEKGNKRIGFTDPVAGVQSLIDYVAFIGVATNFLNEVRKTPEGIAAFKSVSGIDITDGYDLKDKNLVEQVSFQLYDEKGNKRIGFTDPVAGVQSLIDYVAFIGVATNYLNEVRKTPAGIAAFKSVSGIDVTSGFDLKDQNLVTQVSYQLYDEKGNKRIGFTDPVAGVQGLIDYVAFIGVATNFLNEVRKTPAGIAAFRLVSGIDVTNGFDLKDQNLVTQVSYQLYDEKGNKRIGFTDPVAGVQALIDYVAFIGVATNFLNEVRKTPAGIAAFKSVSGIDVTSGFDLKDQNLVTQVSYQLYDEKGNKRIGFTDPVAGVQALIDYVAFIGVATNFLNEVRKTPQGIAAFKSVSGIDITDGYDLKDQNLVTQVSYQLYDEKGNKRIGFTDPVAGVQALIDYVAFIGVATNFLNEVRKTPAGIAAFMLVSGIDVTNGFDLKDQNLVTQVSYQLYDEKGNKRIGFTDPVAGVQALIDYVAFIGVATNFLNEVRKTPAGIAAFKSVSGIDVTSGFDLKDQNLVTQVSYQLYDEKGNKRIGFTDPVAGVQGLIDYVAFIGVATNFLNEVRKTPAGIAAFRLVSGIDVTNGFDLKDQNLVTQVSYQLYDEKGNKRIGFTDPVAGVQGLIDYVAFIGVATNFLNEVRKTPAGIAAFKSVSGIDITDGYDLKDQNLVTQVSYQLYDEKGNKRIGFTDPVAGVQGLIDYVAFIGVATNFLNEVRKTPAGIAAFRLVSGIDVTNGFDLKDQNLVTQVSYQLYDEKGNKRIGFTDPVAGVQGLIDYVAFIGVATNFLNEVRKTPAGIAAFKSVSGIDITDGYDLKDQNLVTQVSYQLYDEKGNKRIGFTDPVAGVQALIDYVAFIGVATNFLNEVRKTPAGIAAFKSVSGIDVTSGFDLKDQNLVTQVSYQLYDEKGNKRIGFTDPVAGVQALIDYVAFIGVATNFLNEVRKTPAGIAAFKSVSGIDVTSGFDLKDENLVTQVSYQLYDEKGNKRIGFTDPVAGVQGLIDYVAFIGVATNFLNEVRKTPAGIVAFKSVSGIDVTSGFDLKDQNLVTQVSYQLYDEKGNKRIGFTDPVAGVQALIDYVAFIGVATNFLNEVRKTPAGIAAFKSVSGIDVTSGFDLKDQNLVTQVSYQLYDEKGNKRIGFIDPVAGVQSLIDYVAFIGVATNFLNEVRKTPEGIAAFKSVSGIDITDGYDLKDKNLVEQVSFQLYDEKGNKRIGFTDPVAGVQGLIDYVAFIGVATNFLNEVRKTPEGIAAFKSVSGIDVTNGFDLKDQNLVTQVSYQLYDEKGNKRIGFTDPVAGVQGLIDYVAFIGVATNFLNEVRKTPEGIAAFKSVSGIDVTSGFDLKDQNLVTQVSYQLYDEKGNKRIGFTDPVAGVQSLIDYVAFIGVATNFLNEVRKTPEGIAAFKSVSGIDITDGYDLKDKNLVEQVSFQLYDEKGNKRIGFTDPVAGVQSLIDYVAFIGVATNYLNEVRKTPAGIAAFKSVSGIDITDGYDLKDQNLVTQVSYQLYDEKGNKRIGFTDPVAGVQALIDYVAFIGVATNFLNEVRKTPAGIAAFKSVSGIDVTNGFDLKDQNLVTQVSYQLYDEKGNKRIGFTDPVAGVQALIDYVAFIGVATNFLNEVRKTPAGIAAFKSVSGIDVTSGFDLKDQNLVTQVSYQLYDEKGNKRIGFTDPVAGVQALIDYVAFIGVATNFLNEVRKTPAGIAAFKSVSGIDVTNGFDLKDQNLVTQVSYQLYDEKGNKRIGFTDPVAGVQSLIDYVAFIGVATNFLNEVRKTPAGIAAFKSVSGIDVTSGFDLKDQNLVTQVSYQLYDEKGNKRIGFTDPVAGVQALIDYVAFIGVATNFLNEVRKTPAGIAAFKYVSGIDVTSGFDLKDQNLVTQVSYQLYDAKGDKRIGFTDPVAGVQALIDYVQFIGAATNYLNEVRKTPQGIYAFKYVSGIDVSNGFDLKDDNLIQQVSYQLYDVLGNKTRAFNDPVFGVQALISYVNSREAAAFRLAATTFLNEVRKSAAGLAAFKAVTGIDITYDYNLNDPNLAAQVHSLLFDAQGNKRIGYTDPVAGVQELIASAGL